MHRTATEVEILQDIDTKYINVDGTIFKGICEILRGSGAARMQRVSLW
jgi:hypothetical protein